MIENPSRTPDYDELPVSPQAPAGSSWGLWGDDDQLGTVNWIDEAASRHGASLVRRGAVFPLDLAMDVPEPPLLGRRAYQRHQLLQRAGTDDYYDDFHPQASTQWDALKHVKHLEAGYYNGIAVEDVEKPGATVLGIHNLARRGVVAPFVLLDLAQAGRPGNERHAITADELDAALSATGITAVPGTVLLVRTGWAAWYASASPHEQAAVAEAGEQLTSPGLAAQEDTARWLWNHRIAMVASDSPALEATPFDQNLAGGFLHYRLIALLGLQLGELFNLEDLARDCAADGIHQGLFTSAPLHLPGGSGSPANALAVK